MNAELRGLYKGDVHFGVYLMHGESKLTYSISDAFKNALDFVADSHARTDNQGQVSVGVFTNVDGDLYRKAASVVAKLNRSTPNLPVFDEKKPIVIEDIIKLCDLQP